jgi:hypothetical protein
VGGRLRAAFPVLVQENWFAGEPPRSGGWAGVRDDSGLALHPDGALERRTRRIHAGIKERRNISFTETEIRLLESEDSREWLEGLQLYTLLGLAACHVSESQTPSRVRLNPTTPTGFP